MKKTLEHSEDEEKIEVFSNQFIILNDNLINLKSISRVEKIQHERNNKQHYKLFFVNGIDSINITSDDYLVLINKINRGGIYE